MSRRDDLVVRNPVLGLKSFARLNDFDPEVQLALAELLSELGTESRDKAEYCWKKHKAPLAAYWKAVSVYANHVARALRRSVRESA